MISWNVGLFTSRRECNEINLPIVQPYVVLQIFEKLSVKKMWVSFYFVIIF